MDDHLNHHSGPGWRAPLVFIGFAAIGAYFLLSEHRLHALSLAPWILILGACPLMHFFMHGSHGGHGGHGRQPGSSDSDRGGPVPPADPGPHQHHH